MSNNWTITLEDDPETGDLILPFTDEILQSVGWKEGDTLEWIDNKNGSWTLRKLDEKSTDTTK
jgi:bifunctional DNA-binding transcriptional regulator/antitoxin component of YhaV-PrlF toxin-antitoxin module